MKPEDKSIITLILITASVVACFGLFACNQYPAQKSPWPVGTEVELHDIRLPHTDPITVTGFMFDDADRYDGAYHYIYSIRDAMGREYTHVIDYQLREVKK